MNKPYVSAIMPVYNGEAYLSVAIESILGQDMPDFELIIVNDGSTDSSAGIIGKIADPRVRPVHLPKNMGNYPARNIGMALANGKYICVMDCDDIAHSNRLSEQTAFLEANPDIGMCGSFVRNIGSYSGILERPVGYTELKVLFLKNNFCTHPSLMARRNLLVRYGLFYHPRYVYAADYDFIVKAMQYFQVVNIPHVFLNYRWHPQQITTAHYAVQQRFADHIRLSQLKYFRIVANIDEEQTHLVLVKGARCHDKDQFREALRWANKLMECNQLYKYFDQQILIHFFRKQLKSILPYENS